VDKLELDHWIFVENKTKHIIGGNGKQVVWQWDNGDTSWNI
jgi:hypothetical protein